MIDRSRFRSHSARDRLKIERDPEVEAFIDELLPHATFAELAAECVARFGKDRAPGRSTIHRYWHRRRASEASR